MLRNGALILISWQPIWLEFAYFLENTDIFYLMNEFLSNLIKKGLQALCVASPW
jgi:hypothetical protein